MARKTDGREVSRRPAATRLPAQIGRRGTANTITGRPTPIGRSSTSGDAFRATLHTKGGTRGCRLRTAGPCFSSESVLWKPRAVYFLAVAVISICPSPTSLATTTVVLRQNLSTGDGAVSPRSMRLTQSRAPPDRVSVLAHGTVERVWTTPLGGSFSTRAPCLSTNSGCEVSPGQAARRSYRWWSPPTSGRATMRPAPTASTPRASGVSLPSAR